MPPDHVTVITRGRVAKHREDVRLPTLHNEPFESHHQFRFVCALIDCRQFLRQQSPCIPYSEFSHRSQYDGSLPPHVHAIFCDCVFSVATNPHRIRFTSLQKPACLPPWSSHG